MSVTKAIIPVAGWGTRRLPITKSIEKCMLPIGNRPIVDYVVRDCILAGITDIYFVVSTGSTQLQQYYSDNQALNDYLHYNGKDAMVELAKVPTGVRFHYIEQDPNAKYGTAVPVAMAVPYLQKGESVMVALGDCFFYNRDNSSDLMVLQQSTRDGANSMLAVQVDPQEVSRYGVVQFNQENGLFEQIVEHPPVGQAPSNYINTGSMILTYDVLLQVYNYCSLDLSGEYWLISVINQYVLDGGAVQVVPGHGEFLDGGNVHGWLHANETIIRQQHA